MLDPFHISSLIDLALGAVLFGAGVYVGAQNVAPIQAAEAEAKAVVAKAETVVAKVETEAKTVEAAVTDPMATAKAAISAALANAPK